MDIYSVFYGLLVIALGFLLAIVALWFTKRLTRSFAGEARSKSLGRVVYWLVLIFSLLIGCLVIFNANATSVALVVGALTFALTFGLQNVIQNFVAGLLIAIDGRIQLGQWVEIGDRPWQTGPAEVLDISLQKVKLRELGGKVYFVPNSYIFTHKVLNFSEVGYFEVQVPLIIPYHKDAEKTKSILVDVAQHMEHVYPKSQKSVSEIIRAPSKLERMGGAMTSEMTSERLMPAARLVRTTQDGVEFLVSMWTPNIHRYNEVASEYIRRSIEAMEAAAIKLKVAPFATSQPYGDHRT
jgi:small-conductance mechanosensitive channel